MSMRIIVNCELSIVNYELKSFSDIFVFSVFFGINSVDKLKENLIYLFDWIIIQLFYVHLQRRRDDAAF